MPGNNECDGDMGGTGITGQVGVGAGIDEDSSPCLLALGVLGRTPVLLTPSNRRLAGRASMMVLPPFLAPYNELADSQVLTAKSGFTPTQEVKTTSSTWTPMVTVQ